MINVGPVDLANIVLSSGRCGLGADIARVILCDLLEAMRYRKPILTSDRDFLRNLR